MDDAPGVGKSVAKHVAQAAMVAAAYAALTLALAPISFGEQQFRLSEALTVLPAFMPSAVPGLFVGCVISNLVSPMGPADLVLGSLATLLAAFLTRRAALAAAGARLPLALRAFLAATPPVAVNALAIGAMLSLFMQMPFGVASLGVLVGQAVSCYGLGAPLFLAYDRLSRKRARRGPP